MSKAKAIADALDGVEVRDAIDIVGNALNIAAKKDSAMALIDVYIIAKMVNHMNGRRAIIEIKDNGNVTFEIAADDGKELLAV